MAKVYKAGDEVLIPGTVACIDPVDGTVLEVTLRDEVTTLICPDNNDFVDPNGRKTIQKETIWLPTAPLTAAELALMETETNRIGGRLFGAKRGGEDFLSYVLVRIEKTYPMADGTTQTQIQWATWECNTQKGVPEQAGAHFFYGHYFDVDAGGSYPTEAHAYAAALEDFNLRNWA